MRLRMMLICDKIKNTDRIGDQRGVRLSLPLISKAGWFYTLIPSIFCPKMGVTLGLDDRGFARDAGNLPPVD